MKNIYVLAFFIFPFLISPEPLNAQLANSLLWEVSGNGLEQPSYLYGTMHVADKRAFRFSKSVMPAFESCSGYAMELDPGEIDPMAMLEMMKLDSGETLRDMFSEEQWTTLDDYFKENLNGSVEAYNAFSPFFVYTMIIQTSFKSQMSEALDLYFYKEAKEAGKELTGLETLEEQIDAIRRMKNEDQVKMLMDALDDEGDGGKEIKKLLKYYRKGKLEALLELTEEADYGSEFEVGLIDERNHKMADRLEPLIRAQSTFVAVGALHLPGEEGIINLLRQKGYTVEAKK